MTSSPHHENPGKDSAHSIQAFQVTWLGMKVPNWSPLSLILHAFLFLLTNTQASVLCLRYMIDLSIPITKSQLKPMLIPQYAQEQIYKKTQETESLYNRFSPTCSIDTQNRQILSTSYQYCIDMYTVYINSTINSFQCAKPRNRSAHIYPQIPLKLSNPMLITNKQQGQRQKLVIYAKSHFKIPTYEYW